MEMKNVANEHSWEAHADWWIDGFTGGIDPEYEEQIIPLVLTELKGHASVLDVGCGEGQLARAISVASPGIHVVGVDPTGSREQHGEVREECVRREAEGPQAPVRGDDAHEFADVIAEALRLQHRQRGFGAGRDIDQRRFDQAAEIRALVDQLPKGFHFRDDGVQGTGIIGMRV